MTSNTVTCVLYCTGTLLLFRGFESGVFSPELNKMVKLSMKEFKFKADSNRRPSV